MLREQSQRRVKAERKKRWAEYRLAKEAASGKPMRRQLRKSGLPSDVNLSRISVLWVPPNVRQEPPVAEIQSRHGHPNILPDGLAYGEIKGGVLLKQTALSKLPIHNLAKMGRHIAPSVRKT